MITVAVKAGDASYPVVVGGGARHHLGATLAPVFAGRDGRAVVVTQENIELDVDCGVPCDRIDVPDGEQAKSLVQVEALCRRFAQLGLSRHDVVVAVGGGVVSDLAGFAAAVYHRGVRYVTVATTLLAQVDAAIGGKTGVNLPEGKNLVGAFWQPTAVLCDTDALRTLPDREWASGRGEMAKYAFLPNPEGGRPGTGEAATLLGMDLEHQVAHCVAVKAAVVGADEREGGRRVILNYGHTLAHALEAAAFEPGRSWDLRHGEAVGIGLVFAALLARRLKRIDDDRVEEHRQVVSGFGLTSALPGDVDPGVLVDLMARDKKADHDLTFVLDGPRGVEPVRDVPRATVLAALAEHASLR